MLTIKLVVIGNSGVGKTSLRGQYISGRFSTGYRATIGADFITKTLPHPTNPNETVTLQIWDTAGQERFSSLSSAFFRGADAALLMYDVNQPSSLHALDKWWDEFCTNAPLAEEDMEDYCCVVVGNKMDLVSEQGEGSRGPAVSEREASEFIEELIPRSQEPDESQETSAPHTPHHTEPPPHPITHISFDTPDSDDGNALPNGPAFPDTPGSESITISLPRHHTAKRSSRTHSAHSHRSTLPLGTVDTIGTMHTGYTAFHTPSSSYFDVFESARSSPIPPSRSASRSRSRSRSASSSFRSRPRSTPRPPVHEFVLGESLSLRRRRSTSSLSSLSAYAPTITPSLFTNRTARPNRHGHDSSSTPPTPTDHPPRSRSSSVSSSSSTYHLSSTPRTSTSIAPDRGPRHFLASAKTGEGVADVFRYICARVVKRWEWEEARQARLMHFGEANRPVSAFGEGGRGRERGRKGIGSVIRLRLGMDGGAGAGAGEAGMGWGAGCCSL